MRTRLVLATIPVAVVSVVAVAPSHAGPKQTKKSYTAAASPDPSAQALETCQGLFPSGQHKEAFTNPVPGRMSISMTGFQGDWDLCVFDKSGEMVASSTGFVEATTETVTFKIKKAKQQFTIVAANFAGGPTAQVSYVFTHSLK